MTQEAAADRDRCTVTICRGCCCGDSSQYPDVDHAALAYDLRQRVEEVARVQVVDCLLKCDEANIVVVSPTASRRRAGAKPVWLARVFDTGINELIARWICAGGPGATPAPDRLRASITRPFVRPETPEPS
ncbi:(2Fe-2S) ferredoxin domain-containing protein [uncultured Nocardioides sp.]|uniref:(2Fe-2S) ferredoxin domain-containing protein n=1 Tax=uncultured Nocardioides sp. TaxID=198441 RepID=UPI0026083C50|nr:(2Fe-2S) ferredoxin domain-containing protein [uncultured Nocardioides sp.]